MKKIILPISFAIFGLLSTAHGQLISGKFPTTITTPEIDVPTKTVMVSPLSKEKLVDYINENDPNGTMLAMLAETSVSFPEDGTIVKADDGSLVWRVKIQMPQSLGLGLYFDKYQLPEGVEMYIYNENKKHIKGTYSHLENLEDKMFATDPVQGEIAYLELNIHPSVNIEEIELHVNEVASYFRGGLRELEYYADESTDGYGTLAPDDDLFFRSASRCMINAICEEGSGFDVQRKSTVHTLIKSGMGIYTCSGSMINNSGNDPDVGCVRYILTASHCEGSNAKSGSVFSSQYIFRFNYETPTCEYTSSSAPVANSITGAQFVSRSEYTEAMDDNAGLIKGDFLLMRILTPMNPSWGVMMSGYKANLPTLSATAPKKFMGFHHPAGDAKKLTVYRNLTNFSLGAAGTHWQVLAESGYSAGGSSGSALYDPNGKIIGIASVAINGHMTPTECLVAADGTDASRTSRDLKYSKLSYCWLNPGDDGSAAKQLKPWLDPTDAGVMETEAVTSSCTAAPTSNDKIIYPFDAGMNVYPNPSIDGTFELNISITNPAQYNIDILDITGKTVLSKSYENLGSQIIKMDLSHVTNGVYFVRLSNEYGATTQKIVVNK